MMTQVKCHIYSKSFLSIVILLEPRNDENHAIALLVPFRPTHFKCLALTSYNHISPGELGDSQ